MDGSGQRAPELQSRDSRVSARGWFLLARFRLPLEAIQSTNEPQPWRTRHRPSPVHSSKRRRAARRPRPWPPPPPSPRPRPTRGVPPPRPPRPLPRRGDPRLASSRRTRPPSGARGRSSPPGPPRTGRAGARSGTTPAGARRATAPRAGRRGRQAPARRRRASPPPLDGKRELRSVVSSPLLELLLEAFSLCAMSFIRPMPKQTEHLGSRPILGKDWGVSVRCCDRTIHACSRILAKSWCTSGTCILLFLSLLHLCHLNANEPAMLCPTKIFTATKS